MLMHILNVGVGMTFSGGVIDLFLFGILQGNEKTNWIMVPLVGIAYFVVYYFLFSFLIKKFDWKTPGRDDSSEVKLYKRSDFEAKKSGGAAGAVDEISEMICHGLGGKKNISDVDCCATRLRCTVYKAELVQDDLLKASGASGVVRKGNGVQVIYGPKVTVIKSNLEDYLETAPNEEYTAVSASEEKTAETTTATNKKVVNTIVIGSPITGEAMNLSKVPDEGFAGKMMGDGAAVEPKAAEIKAPVDGEVTFVFPSKHAIGFQTKTGIAMLLHVGIDTVKLDGKGFEVLVSDGQEVKKGDVLMKIDIPFLKENAPSVVTPVICTELEDNQKIRLLHEGSIKAGDDLFAIDVYEE